MNKQDIKIFQERDFGEIISVTISFFIQEIKPIIKVLFYFVGPFVLINSIFSSYFNLGTVNDFTKMIEMFKGNNITQTTQNTGGTFIIIILNLFQGIMLYTVIAVYAKLYSENGRGSFEMQDIWNELSKRYFTVLGGQILAGLMVVAGFILLIIPGFYLLIALSLIFVVIIFEELSIGDSISRSFVLIKGSWWFTFGTFFVLGILTSMLSAMFVGAIGAASLIGSNQVTTAFFNVIIGFGNVIISAVSVFLPIFLYASFVTEKEKPTLLDRITNINKNNENDSNIFEESKDVEEEDIKNEEQKTKNENDWEELLDKHKKTTETHKENPEKTEESKEVKKTDTEKNRFKDENENDRFKPKY